MTKEKLITILHDASAAIYMAENWAYSNSKLAELCKARKQLQNAIQSLEQDRFPQDLDEAAERYSNINENYACWIEGGLTAEDADDQELIKKAFKAGAEWMAGQGIVADFEVNKLAARAWLTAADEDKFQKDVYDSFEAGDKVIVQIRRTE